MTEQSKSHAIILPKKVAILRSSRPLWIIVQRAWWRGGGDKWVPVENTLTHARGYSWAKWEENYKNADSAFKRQSRRNAKAIKVMVTHFEPPLEHQDIAPVPWWRQR
jgi:hypothetical protein